jgi:hypothetical protein
MSAVALSAAAATLAIASSAGAVGPPDGRGYELVSPPEKAGAVVHFPAGGNGPGFGSFSAFTGGSADGQKLVWFSTGAFADPQHGLPTQYESERTAAGWQTTNISPRPTDPNPSTISMTTVRDVTDDFSSQLMSTTQQFGYDTTPRWLRRDLYLRSSDSTLTWLSRPETTTPALNGQADLFGQTADAGHVVFGTTERLTPAALLSQRGRLIYDRTGGHTVLVNVDSAGALMNLCGGALGYRETWVRRHQGAISQDGSRIFFTVPDPGTIGSGDCAVPYRIYLRENATTTTYVSQSQRTVADPNGTQAAIYQGATDDGSAVFFTSMEALTDDAEPGSSALLYRYDVASRRLALLTPNPSGETPGVQAVYKMAGDGSRLYVVATGVLAPGGVDGGPSDPIYNLYTYDGRGFSYIGRVGQYNPLNDKDFNREARVTEDGNTLVFVSTSSIDGAVTGGFKQVYRYDASTGETTCISCPSDAADATEAWLTRDDITDARKNASRNLSEDGNTVYFDTATPLVPQDANRAIDVYQWRDGQVSLVTSGKSKDPSYFIDASADGTDIWFVTTERLVPQDDNVDPDIYDARVGGGFPADVSQPELCTGDACQGQPRLPDLLPQILSDTDFGDGNLAEEPDTPATKFSIGKFTAKAKRSFARTGSTTLVVRTSAAGTAKATLFAKFGKRFRQVDRTFADASKAGRVRLKVSLSNAAVRQLARRGKLAVRITATVSGAERTTTTSFSLAKAVKKSKKR